MKLLNQTLCWVIYCGQQADGTAGSQTPMRGGRIYLPLDQIFPPPAEEMINNIGGESDDDGETWSPNPRPFPMTKTGFQKFEQMLQRMIIRQQQYLEVIWNRALRLFADYEQSLIADKDVAWLCVHNHVVNPPGVGSLANRKLTSICPAAN